jgi:hypothetical protein
LKEELFSGFFPDIAQQFNNHNWLSERATLAAINTDVDDLNAIIQNFRESSFRSNQLT